MDDQFDDFQKGQEKLNGIADNPPTFEEAVATKNDQQVSTKKGNKTDNNIGLTEVNQNNTEQDTTRNPIVVVDNEEIVEDGPVKTCCSKFIATLKLISAVCTVAFDLLVWACSLGFLIVGCLILEQKIDLVRILISHFQDFRSMGQMCISVGVLFTAFVVPLGLLGVLRRNRRLLKGHNILLFLTLLAESITLFVLYKSLNKQEKAFSADLKNFFDNCYVKEIKTATHDDCCCFLTPIGNETFTRYTKKVDNDISYSGLCWTYHTNDSRYWGNFQNLKMIYTKKCTDNRDLYPQVQKLTRQVVYTILPVFMILQVMAFSFGIIQSKVIRSHEPPSPKKKRKYRRPPRNKCELYWRRSLDMFYRRFFYVILTILFLLLFFLYKMWQMGFTVRVGELRFTIWEILRAQNLTGLF